MGKTIIRLTESDLHNLIRESVNNILLAEGTYQVIGPCLQNGESDEEAKEFLHGYDFSEDTPETEEIGYADLVDSYNGIDLFHDYGADYYFFALHDDSRDDFMNRLQQGEYWQK